MKNLLQLFIGDSIKIGRNTYEIKSGDYILDNGYFSMFCSGDNRILRWSGFDTFSYIVIPKSIMKTIQKDVLKTVEIKMMVYFYFQNK